VAVGVSVAVGLSVGVAVGVAGGVSVKRWPKTSTPPPPRLAPSFQTTTNSPAGPHATAERSCPLVV
jgi:hypothetical protein